MRSLRDWKYGGRIYFPKTINPRLTSGAAGVAGSQKTYSWRLVFTTG
jgi:hypothetical protein